MLHTNHRLRQFKEASWAKGFDVNRIETSAKAFFQKIRHMQMRSPGHKKVKRISSES